MNHVLNNPAYNALCTGNQNLAMGTDDIKFFDSEVSPFVGFRNNSAESFGQLYEMLPFNRYILHVSPEKIALPANWKQLGVVSGYQMIYEGSTIADKGAGNRISLSEEHIPQMISLTKLTNPGPFASRTIEFGHYEGIFDGEQLVAMAGQRLNPAGYTEISAVCTHPDYLGRGYARQLLISQVNRMLAASNVPFLHVRGDNERAVKVYQSLGFSIRTNVHFNILTKEE